MLEFKPLGPDERYLDVRNSRQLQPKLPLIFPPDDEVYEYITEHRSQLTFESTISEPAGLYSFEEFYKRTNHGSLAHLDFVDTCMDFRFATNASDRLRRAVDAWNLYLRAPNQRPMTFAGARKFPLKQASSLRLISQRSLRVIPQEPSKVRITREENLRRALEFHGSSAMPQSPTGHNRFGFLSRLGSFTRISSLGSKRSSSSRSSLVDNDALYDSIEKKITSEIKLFSAAMKGEYKGSGSFCGHPPSLFAAVFVECVNAIALAGEQFMRSTEFLEYAQVKVMSHTYASEKDFQPLRMLGRGSFAQVHAEIRRDTGKLFAVKALSKREIKRRGIYACCWIEHQAMTAASSPFVQTLKYAFQSEEQLFLVMDLLPGGDLGLRMGEGEMLTQKEARFYVAQISLGLDHLHSLGFIHRDVKPENILLDAKGHCCLSDLGLVVTENAKGKLAAGTPGYMAPEVFKRDEFGVFDPVNGTAVAYNRSVDYWSLGCVLYQMITGSSPFFTEKAMKFAHERYGRQARNLKHKLSHYAACSMPIDYDSSGFDGSEEAKHCQDLCSKLLTRDPLKRLGGDGDFIHQLKSHPWFAKILHWESVEGRSMEPPFVPNVYSVNAMPLKACLDSMHENYASEIPELSGEEQSRFTNWEYISSEGRQAEIVEYLEWIEKEKRKESVRNSQRRSTCSVN